ncbi:hypothetical protein ACQ4PT_047058 [Festuca glaucescens]
MTADGEMTTTNKKVVLRRYVTGYPTAEDMEVVATPGIPLRALRGSTAAVVVKNLYLSCDPWMRGRMTRHDDGDAVPADDFVLGEALVNYTVGAVVDSTHPEFSAGDLVWGMSAWEEYTLVTKTEGLFKINHPELPLSYYTGVLGMTGLTAYVGLFEVGKPKGGESIFVSAAAGAVGQVVGQLAKIAGCYVVGSAGSGEKVNLLKNEMGFDDAFNYKEEKDLDATLRRCLPGGIDIYFDNVGGTTLDAALLRMKPGGRVVICGMISQYNLPEHEGVRNLFCLIPKRIQMEGFAAMDYYHLYGRMTLLNPHYDQNHRVVGSWRRKRRFSLHFNLIRHEANDEEKMEYDNRLGRMQQKTITNWPDHHSKYITEWWEVLRKAEKTRDDTTPRFDSVVFDYYVAWLKANTHWEVNEPAFTKQETLELPNLGFDEISNLAYNRHIRDGWPVVLAPVLCFVREELVRHNTDAMEALALPPVRRSDKALARFAKASIARAHSFVAILACHSMEDTMPSGSRSNLAHGESTSA